MFDIIKMRILLKLFINIDIKLRFKFPTHLKNQKKKKVNKLNRTNLLL